MRRLWQGVKGIDGGVTAGRNGLWRGSRTEEGDGDVALAGGSRTSARKGGKEEYRFILLNGPRVTSSTGPKWLP
jgi:hypothetical protein